LVAANRAVNSVCLVCSRPRWVGISLAPCTQDTVQPAGCKMDDGHLNVCSSISSLQDTSVCVWIPGNSCPLHGFLKMENPELHLCLSNRITMHVRGVDGIYRILNVKLYAISA
jgi:hypothetical protein